MKRHAVASLPLTRYRLRYHCRKSSALVIVLACLVFLTVLIVAFFASVSAERQSAQFYANSSSVKLLADSAVDIVMGQIKDATKGTDSTGNTLAWASQPGMIRTYNTSGAASSYYKLYSWGTMVGSGAFNPSSSAELPPSTWASTPALYTDLNDPISGVYPIVDPSATNSVIGFDIGVSSSAGYYASSRDAAPMPVQWLYVLKDGSLAPATGSPGNTATVAAASPSNPIVARVAFWTDDDTSKININTAAGDVWTNNPGGQPTNAAGFWDTPRIASTFERTYLALNQPVHGEFQRYPGHPATTFLSAVFPGMSTNNLFAITPRVNGGGSNGGSLSITNSATIPQKTDRLYASVDEMMFSTNLSTATNRVGNQMGAVPLANTNVQSANFFLTAHSRAPEVNLYNEPRIVTWPVNETNGPAYRTAYDSLLAFCGSLVGTNSLTGTIGTNAYYFQRASSIDPVNDLPVSPAATGVGRNRVLLSYLTNMTSQPVPGFSTNGETFLSKYPKNAANSGNSTATGRDQIITEIFDYIRAINEQDSSSPSTMTNSFTPTTTAVVNADTEVPVQSGQITPIYDQVSNTRGFGRFPTVVEAGFLFWGIGQTTATTTNYPPYASSSFNYGLSNEAPYIPEHWIPASPNYANGSYAAKGGTATNSPSGCTRVQAVLLSNLFDPSMGFDSTMHGFWIEYDNLNSFTWKDGNYTPPYPMFARSSTTNAIAGEYTQYAGHIGIKSVTDGGNGNGVEQHHNVDDYLLRGTGKPPEGLLGFPAYSIPLDMTTGSSLRPLSFGGGTLIVKLRAPGTSSSSPGPVIQQITIVFPPFSCPVPALAPYVTDYAFGTNAVSSDFRDLALRFSRAPSSSTGPHAAWITEKDAFRSMVLDASQADARTVAGMTNVPSAYFTACPYYNNANITVAGHGIVENSSQPYFGTTYGALVPGVSYRTNSDASFLTNQGVFGTTYAGCESNGMGYYQATNAIYAQPTNNATILGQPYVIGSSSTNGMISSASIPIAFNTGGPSGAKAANGVFAGGGSSTVPGDWDTGLGTQPDGAYINKVDEGDDLAVTSGSNGGTPYFTQPLYNSYLITPSFFSPNRQMPSPVMFGSLPTGVIAQKPWQTLLFRPDPGTASGTSGHWGATSPADHLLLDLFNMPVVEPYPISDPFSTAGKINMNYQIVPFTYITRSTAVQAVLRSEQILAIPTTDGPSYKSTSNTPNRRYYLDLNQTLTGFTNRFGTGDIFRSASEICNLWLVPSISSNPQTYSGMQAFWKASGANGGALTGDNIRERPYANIYPRLTTKSNTFTVHYRVETLKKVPTTAANQWVEGTDVVTGEYRGSTTLERYLDTSDTRIPDYAALSQPLAAGQAIDNFYKFRVVETKQFTP